MTRTKRILIVDDETTLLTAISEVLNRHGYEVIACSTVADGVRKVEEQNFDAALLDYHIGPDKGTVVAQAIHKYKPNLPYVYLSGFQAEEVTDTKVLSKPIGMKDLIHEVGLLTQSVNG